MKKKLSLSLCLLLSAMMFLVGCSKKESINPDVISRIKANLNVIIDVVCVDLPDDDNGSIKYYTEAEREASLNSSDDVWNTWHASLKENNALAFESRDVYTNAVNSYLGSESECGKLMCLTDDLTIDTYDKGYTSNMVLVGENRTLTMTVLFDENLNVTSIVFNPDYTIGENLTKAGLNTLMGMGTVFSVLVLIMCIIFLFKLIPAIEKKIADKKNGKSSTQDSVSKTLDTIAAKEEGELSDDLELVAVISAAIAAYEGNSGTDGFVVRSIRKSNSKKWQNAQY